jgi:hypothetical protein
VTSPALTFVLFTPDNFETVRKTVSYVARDAGADAVELLIGCAEPNALQIEEAAVAAFHSARAIRCDMTSGSGKARAVAVIEALAPIVAFGEDHCFPQPGWTAALLRAHEKSYAAVGPVVMNANPARLVSWADLLMGYGPWLAPGASGERDHLPGHNSSYKREVLLGLAVDLPFLMEAESALHWRLKSEGHRMFQQAEARVAHTNFEGWSTWLSVSYHAGRVFAAVRSAGWSRGKRLAFFIGSPLIPFVRLIRHLRQANAAGLPVSLMVQVAPVLLVGLFASAAGEAMGSVHGAGRSRATLVQWDFHRNAPRQATG